MRCTPSLGRYHYPTIKMPTDSGAGIPPAGTEPQPSVVTEVSQIINLSPVTSSGAFEKSFEIAAAVESFITGAGNVDLVYLTIRYQFTDSKQKIAFTITDSAATGIDLKSLPMSPWSFSEVSNAFTQLQEREHTLNIPSFVTRQIRPASSLAPPFKLHLLVSQGVRCTLEIGLKHNVRIMYGALN